MLSPADIRALPTDALPRALYDAGCAPGGAYRMAGAVWADTASQTKREERWEPHLRLDQAIGLLDAAQVAGYLTRVQWYGVLGYGEVAVKGGKTPHTAWSVCLAWRRADIEPPDAAITDTQASALCRLRLLWEVRRRGEAGDGSRKS